MLLVIEPVAFIFLTVRERIGAVALAFPLFVFAFVLVSVRINRDAFAIRFVS